MSKVVVLICQWLDALCIASGVKELNSHYDLAYEGDTRERRINKFLGFIGVSGLFWGCDYISLDITIRTL